VRLKNLGAGLAEKQGRRLKLNVAATAVQQGMVYVRCTLNREKSKIQSEKKIKIKKFFAKLN
jgi:hypothetical protein